ncbi:unnamed protein product [Rhodiola kirilowii]
MELEVDTIILMEDSIFDARLLNVIRLDQELGETTSCLVESLYLLEESEMKPVMFALKHEKHHFGCVLNLFHILYLSS